MGFDIINKLKKEKGLTNAQLAEKSGVTLSTIDKITSGVNKNPKLDTLQAICRVLGCRLDDFDDTMPEEGIKKEPSENDELTEEDLINIEKLKALPKRDRRLIQGIIAAVIDRSNQEEGE